MSLFRFISSLLVTMIFSSAVYADSWQQLSPSSTPGTRVYHTLTNVNGTIYLFGGFGSANTRNVRNDVINDVWAFDRANSNWSKQTPSNPPSPRQYQAAAESGGTLYVFGGQGSGGDVVNELWAFDRGNNIWSAIETLGTPPPGLSAAKMVALNGVLYIVFGANDNWRASNVVYRYDIAANQWNEPISCPSTMSRYAHWAAIASGGTMIYAGHGRIDNTLKDDIVGIDTQSGQCYQMQTQGPAPRPAKAMAYTRIGAWLMMAGGAHSANNSLNTRAFTDSSESWKLNLNTLTWTQGSNGPSQTAAAMVSLGDGRLLMHGGSRNNVPVDETWIYTADIDTFQACANIDDNLNIHVACLNVNGTLVNLDLVPAVHPEGGSNLLWKLDGYSAASFDDNSYCATVNSSSYALNVPCLSYGGVNYSLQLNYYRHPDDSQNLYWSFGSLGYGP